MEISETVLTLSIYLIQAAAVIAFAGFLAFLWMLRVSVKRTKNLQATKLDALFLAFSSPGFSRFMIFNSPDTLGIGVYAALALEQVGAIKSIEDYIKVNLKIYPDWALTYLSAARYYALINNEQKVKDYLSIASTLMGNQNVINDVDLLTPSEIEKLISVENDSSKSTTITLDSLFDEIRQHPLQLFLVKSQTFLIYGLCTVFVGVLVLLVKNLVYA